MRSINFAPRLLRALCSGSILASLVCQAAAQPAQSEPSERLRYHAAFRTAAAGKAMINGATRAGTRLVAVGDHGVVLLSDDEGRTWRQAAKVPTRSMLTAVSFAGASLGWAVGHWGTILHTRDGGETWTLQHSDTSVDQPLMSVHFSDDQAGWAVGQWSLVLSTKDGGRTWQRETLPNAPGRGRSDLNLFDIFAGRQNEFYVAAEQGMVLKHEADTGQWTYLPTGSKATLWAGLQLADGALLVGGLRGALLRSDDGGRHWVPVSSGTKSSITGLVSAGNTVHGVGMDGVQIVSLDGAHVFSAAQREDRLGLTAVADRRDGSPVIFTVSGPLR